MHGGARCKWACRVTSLSVDMRLDTCHNLGMTESIAQRIRQERDKRGWNQAELSVRAFGNDGRTSDISHWESGKRLPSLPNLYALADAFLISIHELIPVSVHTLEAS